MTHGLHIQESATLGEGFSHGLGVVIGEDVKIGDGVALGSFVVIEEGARIGDNCSIGNHVTICEGAYLGDGVHVADFAVTGRRPRLSASSTARREKLDGVRLGAGCSVGSHTVLMAGSTFGQGCVIGDGAGVRERCTVGERVVIGRAVTVENDTAIGARTRIQSGAYITAYVTLEEDVFIAPMVVTTNDNFMGRTEERFRHLRGCTIRRGARIGGGAHILPGIEIAEEAFVATGSVVTKDVAPRTLVMGVPAKPVREVPREQLLDSPETW